MKNNRGFTLLELMIVIIILGILVSIAIPLYGKAIERARATEAYSQLGGLRKAQQVYYQRFQTYAANLTYLLAAGDIDNPNIAKVDGKSYFSNGAGYSGAGYVVASGTLTAERNAEDYTGTAYTVTMYMNGFVTGAP